MAPPLLLRAAVTIVVEKTIVLHFFIFVRSGSVAVAARQVRWQWQKHGSGGQLGGGGGSLSEAQF